jgi:hypothetical protein
MGVINVSKGPGWLEARPLLSGGLAAPLGVALLALGVALAGLAVNTLRLQATSAAARPSSGPGVRPASITYREPAADGSLISLGTARRSAQLFSGRDDLELRGDPERGAYGAGAYAIFYLESAGPGVQGEQSFKVDARTGEVLEATRLGSPAAAGVAGALSPQEAESRAERFASERFLGFERMSLVERTVALAANGNQLYAFKWAMVAPEAGAELPTSVSVSISSADGEPVWYLAQRESTAIDVRPEVEREQAVATAAGLVERTERWDARAPSSVRLQVVYNQDNRQQLVWAITFPSKRDGAGPGRPSLRVLIDAKSGQPVSHPI